MTAVEKLRAKQFNEGVKAMSGLSGNGGLALFAAGIAQLFPGGYAALALVALLVGLALIVGSAFMPYLMIPEE